MIRVGSQKDTTRIAELMLLAMEGLVKKFRQSEDRAELIALLAKFIAIPGNQYSFHNVLIYDVEEQPAGILTSYDGAAIAQLRKPFFDYLTAHYHPNGFEMELETEAGELYIDVLCVDPIYQNMGIGKALIEAAISKAKALGQPKIGLLVNVENLAAQRLYERLGFSKAGQRFLLGSTHHHLVKTLEQ